MKNRILALMILFLSALSCSKSSDNGNNSPVQVDKTANLKTTGDSANDILSNDNFDKLLIEATYVSGFRPTVAAMQNFETFLRQHSFKQNIEVIYRELSSPNEEKLTLEEIVDLEKENRTAYNNGSTLAIYIYFADAPSEDDVEEENVVTLGAVYLNTSMVIYESTIKKLAGNTSLVPDIETATLNHEFGHLLGLVNLGSPPVNEHEDPDAENHCSVDGCLMQAELQFGHGMKKMLEKRASKGIVVAPGLDTECILDLQANGGR